MIRLCMVLICAAVSILAVGCRTQQSGPRYGGRTAAEWLDLLREQKTKADSSRSVAEVNDALDTMGPAAIPALTNALASDQSWKIRENAAAALGRMGSRALSAVPALIEALKDEHFLVWEAADSALGGIALSSDQSIPAIAAGIKHSNAKVRAAVIDILGALGPRAKSAVPAITGVLNDEDASVREAAGGALKQIEAKQE